MKTPLKLLMVEDSPDDAALLLRMLGQGGYDPAFERVDTPEAFIAALDEHDWDCIIADYSMPRFSAFAALATVKERKLDLPFIVVSGTIGEETAVEAMRAGAHDYLMKNSLKRLVPAIERELREAQVRRERERDKRALEESERRFRALVENSSDGVALVELDGTALYTGPSTRRILGYEPADLIGHNLFEILHPDDMEEAKSMFIRMLEEPGRITSGLFRIRHSDGSWRWVEHISKNLIAESSVQAVVINFRDITERRQAEEAQARLAAILEATSDLVGMADMDGHVKYLNRAGRKMVGISEEEDISSTVISDYHPQWASQIVLNDGIPAATREGIWSGENAILSRDGREIPVSQVLLAHKSPVGATQFLSTIIRDITERKRAEEHVLDIARGVSATTGETFFRSLVEHIARLLEADIAFIGELVGERADRVRSIAVCNDGRIADNFEYDLVNSPCENVINDADKKICSFPSGVQQRFPGDVMLVLRGIEGYVGTPLFDSAGRALGIMVLLYKKPVTNLKLAESMLQIFGVRAAAELERMQAEESLRLSEKKYRDIFESAPIGIFQSTPDGRFISANTTLARILGYASAEELMAVNITEDVYLNREQRAALIDEYDSMGRAYDLELLWKKKDKTPVWIQLTAFAAKDEERKTLHYECFVRDITERKKAEDALQRAEEQLRHSQKMEAVGRLAGGVAHDFNNLLTAIMGCSELLSLQLSAGDPLRPLADEIFRAGERAAALTAQLLAFSRKQMLQPKVLSLNSVVTDLEKMFRRLIGEDIELVTVLAPDLGPVKADPGQLEQVILNLIVNSRDAMPGGGKVIIETSNVDFNDMDLSAHPDARTGPYVMLAVSDTGAGMDSETRSRIFEPFFTTKQVGQGTGLGLSTVYGIIKQSDGDISVYSEPGAGTTFKVYLPRVKAESEKRTGEKESKFAGMPRGTETVLVVEDDQTVRKLACRALRLSGYHVLEAANAGEALLICERHEGLIHLMLVDVIMPQMNGRDLALRLSPLRPEMKTLFMSGYTDNAVFHQSGLDSNVLFIQKPFTPNIISRKVRQVLDGQAE
jgi:PAS domain S-box-containing protein